MYSTHIDIEIEEAIMASLYVGPPEVCHARLISTNAFVCVYKCNIHKALPLVRIIV
jgi:hypothetical protein